MRKKINLVYMANSYLAFDRKKDYVAWKKESLVVIWRWFLDKTKTEKTASNMLQLDMQTEYIVRDIGMFIKRGTVNPKISAWSHLPKRATKQTSEEAERIRRGSVPRLTQTGHTTVPCLIYRIWRCRLSAAEIQERHIFL